MVGDLVRNTRAGRRGGSGMTPNPASAGTDRQIANAEAGAALIVAPETIEFLNRVVDETKVSVVPDGALQERFGGERLLAEAAPDDVVAGEGQSSQPKREASLLAGPLRFAGTVIGFLMGGPAGAALGSVFGELADDVVAEQGNMIWQKLGSALFFRKRAHHEEDAGDCAGRRCRSPAESAQALRNRRL